MRSYGTRAHNRFFPPTNRPKWGETFGAIKYAIKKQLEAPGFYGLT